MEKFYFLSGFNGATKVVVEENATIFELMEKGYDVEKIDYYEFYKQFDSSKIVTEITNTLIQKYYENDCKPLNIVGWSLGGALLVEVLHMISSLNEQADLIDKTARIEIGKIILFSPAWYVIDVKNFVRSHFDRNFYETQEAKKSNKKAEIAAVPYLTKHPLALLHLFKLSHFSKQKTNYLNCEKESLDGLEILSKYDTTIIVPENDAYVNVNATMKAANDIGVDLRIIGNYGHMAPVNMEVIESVINGLVKKSK